MSKCKKKNPLLPDPEYLYSQNSFPAGLSFAYFAFFLFLVAILPATKHGKNVTSAFEMNPGGRQH